MCYGNSRSFNVSDTINGNIVHCTTSISSSLSIVLNPPVSVRRERAARYRGGTLVPAEVRSFMIEGLSISFHNLTDEAILNAKEDDTIAELLNGVINASGRWTLKSGGLAKDGDSYYVKIQDLPQLTIQSIHESVAAGLDKMYEEVKRMYDNYSTMVNEMYSLSSTP
jgi:hypothetical protein